jgi:hypothetical protein
LEQRRQQQHQKQQHQKQLQPSQLDAALSVCASVEQVLWLLQAPPASSAAAATRPAFLAAALRHACSLLRQQQQQQQQATRAEVRVALAATALARLADYLAAAPAEQVDLAAAAALPQQLPLDTLAPLLLSVAVLKDGHDWAVGHARLHRPAAGTAAATTLAPGPSPAAASAAALPLASSSPAAARGLDRLTRSVAPEEVCLHAALASAALPVHGRDAASAAPQAAATAAYALARLGPGAARPPPQLCSAMAAAVLKGGHGGGAAALPPKQLALGLWGLATLRIPLERGMVEVEAAAPSPTTTTTPDLVLQLCAATQPRLAQFNAQDLSQVLWSLATARASVPRAWLVAAARALRDRAAEASSARGSGSSHSRRQRASLAPQAAANASWALAVLLPRSVADDDDEKVANLARAASLLGSCAADALVAAAASSDDESSSSSSSFSTQLASNAAWACARLAQQLRSASSASDPSVAARCAAVEASLRSAAERALWPSFFSARRQQQQPPTLRDCANALWACAVLRLEPPIAWQEALWQHSAAAFGSTAAAASASSSSSSSSAASSVADLAWAAARLALSPPRPWRVALSRASLACLPRMTRQQLANTAWASVRLGGAAPTPAGEAAAWWRAWAAASAGALEVEDDDDGATTTDPANAAAAAARDASLMLFAVGTSRSAAPQSMVASAALADPLWLRRCVLAVAEGAAAAAAEGAAESSPLLLPEVARSCAMALFAAAHLASSPGGPNAVKSVAEAWPLLEAPLRLLAGDGDGGGGGARALDGEHTAMALWAVGRIASLSAGDAAALLLEEPARAAAKRLQERVAALAAGTQVDGDGGNSPAVVLSRTTLARLLTALASGGSSVPAPSPRVVEPVFRALFSFAEGGDEGANDASAAKPDAAEAEAAAASLALLTRGTAATAAASWPLALRRDVALAMARSWPALTDPRRAAACIAGLARLGALERRGEGGAGASSSLPPVLGRAWLAAAQWRSLKHLPELGARDLAAMLAGFAALSVRARCAPSPEWLREVGGAAVLLGGRAQEAKQAAALARAALGLARMAHASRGWRGSSSSSSSSSSSPPAPAAPAWSADLADLLVERVFAHAATATPLPGGTLRRASAALALLLRLSETETEGEDDEGVGASASASVAAVHPLAIAALERSAAAGSLELGHLAGAVAALRIAPPTAEAAERLMARAVANGSGGRNASPRSERYARSLLAAGGWV